MVEMVGGMTVTLFVPGPLRHHCGGASELSISAHTVGAALEELERNQAALYRNVCDETGAVRKHLNVFVDQRFDWVISLCDRVREVCPQFPGHPETIHWSIANPAAMLRSVALLVRHGLGRAEDAAALERAVDSGLESAPTPDLGGNSTTSGMGDAVMRSLAA